MAEFLRDSLPMSDFPNITWHPDAESQDVKALKEQIATADSDGIK